MNIFFLPGRPSTSAHRRRPAAGQPSPSSRAAVRRFIASSPSADATPRLPPPLARRLISVSRLDASPPSTSTYFPLRQSPRRNALIHRHRRVTTVPSAADQWRKTPLISSACVMRVGGVCGIFTPTSL
ncbi:TCP-1/cpn60 chaperonin family protein [Striga asiatica]|uniref:TCP-1/cpn60 chaperonin family protein n=1 Tax=Striga asiatica TaxID=4170 RepID=A0A5A7QIE3_STRAF|nr:TCP-1/cpn60 chaperonin family protein [Striga asiatica]